MTNSLFKMTMLPLSRNIIPFVLVLVIKFKGYNTIVSTYSQVRWVQINEVIKHHFHIIDINCIVNFFVHFHVIRFLTYLKHFIDFSRCTQVVNSRMHTSGKVLGHCKHRNHLILNQCISKYDINRNIANLVSLFNNFFYPSLCQWYINTLYKQFFSFHSDSP
jgi:hypothetical protein